MTKAEQKSREYAENTMLSVDHKADVRDAFWDGYEQAEKDLALTWGDIELIHDIMIGLRNDDAYPPMSVAFYKEVLKRFNETRK